MGGGTEGTSTRAESQRPGVDRVVQTEGHRMPPPCGSCLIPQPHPQLASATLEGTEHQNLVGCRSLRVCPGSLTDEETGAQRRCVAGTKQVKDGAGVTVT